MWQGMRQTSPDGAHGLEIQLGRKWRPSGSCSGPKRCWGGKRRGQKVAGESTAGAFIRAVCVATPGGWGDKKQNLKGSRNLPYTKHTKHWKQKGTTLKAPENEQNEPGVSWKEERPCPGQRAEPGLEVKSDRWAGPTTMQASTWIKKNRNHCSSSRTSRVPSSTLNTVPVRPPSPSPGICEPQRFVPICQVRKQRLRVTRTCLRTSY